MKVRILLWMSLLLAPRALAEPSQPTVDKVLEYFQVEAFFNEAPGWFDAAVKRRHKELGSGSPSQPFQTIGDLGRRILPGRNVIKIFRQAYARAITADDMAALYNWMNTPAGIKLRLGYRAAAQAGAKGRQTYFDGEGANVLKPNRKNALATFVTDWQQEQPYAILQVELDYAVRLALSAYQPATGRDSPKFLKDETEPHKSAFVEEGKKYYQVYDAYLLKDMKNAEIDEVAKFATTPAAEAHSAAMQRAMEATMEAAAKTLFDQTMKQAKADK